MNVTRAVAVGSQLVRVVYSVEPRHRSMAGLDDALNAANYGVAIVSGVGSPIQSVGVKPSVVAYPAFGVTSQNEVAVDVQLDRPMVVGLSYTVSVNAAVKSAAGQAVGTRSASLAGASRPRRDRQLRRRVGLVDLASDPFTGGILVDSSGDWASHDGVEGTHKRIWRIALTSRGSFVWMQDFGLDHQIKKPATLSMLGNLRTDLKNQIQRQPDVKATETRVVMDASGLLQLTIKVKTTRDEEFVTAAHANRDGDFLP
jgi:hypothetical protein